MSDNTIIPFKDPSEKAEDALTVLLREGARALLGQAIESEIQIFLSEYENNRDAKGRRKIVRNGYLPSRTIQSGIGDIEIKIPRTRDRGGSGIQFSSNLVPPYLKRTQSMEELLPVLYLKGISTGDFQEALEALVGPKAKGLSASTICHLKKQWEEEHEDWCRRDLTKKRYVYFWVDGVYLNARMDDRQCLLVIVGADEFGKKELVAVEGGFRECEQSWRALLLDLKKRGLHSPPKLCVGDGAMGFWKAIKNEYGDSKQQRCWMHKTGNILGNLPKKLQESAKKHIHNIWMADTKSEAGKAFDYFLDLYTLKYPKAAHCLEKDREELLAFYDFPAEHWGHLRTTNPIESTFATVRLRTGKTRGCLSRKTGLAMVFKLMQSAQKRWRKLNGENRAAEVIEGVNFKDGITAKNEDLRNAA